MSDIFSPIQTFSKTGSSIINSPLSSTRLSRNNDIDRNTLSHSISVTDMIKSQRHDHSNRKIGLQFESTPRYSVPKNKESYMNRITKHSESIPEPSKYSKTAVWKAPLGVMKGSKRNTFLAEAMQRSKHLPAPSAYSPTFKKNISQGRFDKTERLCFLDDVMANSMAIPSSYASDKNKVLSKVLSAKILPPGKHDKSKGWKVPQNDSPNPQSYREIDRGLRIIKNKSTAVSFSKAKRTLFTDEAIKAKTIKK